MRLYGAKQRQLEVAEQLRKKQQPSCNPEALTQEEAERKLREMQDCARQLEAERGARLGTKHEEEKEPPKKDARFLKAMGQKSYMESGMGLDERISRNKHYIARDANKDEY